MRAVLVRKHIDSVWHGLTGWSAHLIDGTTIFSPIDPTRILQPHRDALIISLGIGDFDVRRILVDPGVDPLFCPTSTCSITCPFDTLR